MHWNNNCTNIVVIAINESKKSKHSKQTTTFYLENNHTLSLHKGDKNSETKTHQFKRQLICEFNCHHHHPGDPEEHNITGSLEQVCRIKLC